MGAEGEQCDLHEDIEESLREISDRLDYVNTVIDAASTDEIQARGRDAVESCRDELRNLRRELVERYAGRDTRSPERRARDELIAVEPPMPPPELPPDASFSSVEARLARPGDKGQGDPV